MAIYHCSVKTISRSTGRSATGAAAYRSGSRIVDERTGDVHDYSRKPGVATTMILAPAIAPARLLDRAQLWNEVEMIEKRKDSQLAREMTVALPHELDADQQLALVTKYCQEQFVDQGMIADVCIHDQPGNKHGHIMLSMRKVSAEGFGQKNRNWNSTDFLQEWRQQWAEHCNQALAAAGVNETIDHRSHAERGLALRPHVHMGRTAAAMEQRGIRTDRGDINRRVDQINQQILDLQRQHVVSLDELRELEAERQLWKTQHGLQQLQRELAATQRQHQQRREIEARLAEPRLDKRELVESCLSGLTVDASNAVFDAKRALLDAEHKHRAAVDRYDSLSWFKRNFSTSERRALNQSADKLEAAEAILAKAKRVESQERKRHRPAAVASAKADWQQDAKERRQLELERNQLPDATQVQRLRQEMQQHPEYQRQEQERRRREEQERQEREHQSSRSRSPSPRPR